MGAWTAGKKDNIRALLASMHTVLWEGHTWNPVSIGEISINSHLNFMEISGDSV